MGHSHVLSPFVSDSLLEFCSTVPSLPLWPLLAPFPSPSSKLVRQHPPGNNYSHLGHCASGNGGVPTTKRARDMRSVERKLCTFLGQVMAHKGPSGQRGRLVWPPLTSV